MNPPIRLDIEGAIAIITLDTPQTRNALASREQYQGIESVSSRPIRSITSEERWPRVLPKEAVGPRSGHSRC